jgi:hypothetical protein
MGENQKKCFRSLLEHIQPTRILGVVSENLMPAGKKRMNVTNRGYLWDVLLVAYWPSKIGNCSILIFDSKSIGFALSN